MTNIQEKLLKIFKEVSYQDKLFLHTNLGDINLDSLETLDVMAQINKQFDIEISVDDFIQSKTILSLSEKIESEIE